MKNIILLISLIFLASCANKVAEDKTKSHSEAGGRLNKSQHNTDELFDEINN